MHFSESQRTDLVDRIRRLSRPVEPLPTGETPRPLPGAPVRAVLFDLYGTLFISAAGDIGTEETGARAVYHEAAAAAGIQLPPGSRIDWGAEFRAEIARQHARRRADGVACPEVDVRHIWRAVLEPDGRRMSDEAILRFAVEVECRINPVWPMPGARAALQRLRERGVVLGLVSNAQCFTPLLFDALLDMRVEQAGFSPRCCVWSWQEGEAKPSPHLLHKALTALREEHAIAPDETLFVGNDMLKDIHPALRAGCCAALFAGDARSLRRREDDPRCAGLNPDAVLTALDQL